MTNIVVNASWRVSMPEPTLAERLRKLPVDYVRIDEGSRTVAVPWSEVCALVAQAERLVVGDRVWWKNELREPLVVLAHRMDEERL